MECYPLLFDPILMQRLWGGTRLHEVLGKPDRGAGIGESWELSGVPAAVSVVSNGPYSGNDLNTLIGTYGAELLGTLVLERFGGEFPVLIKFIDAREDLSIQLHPDDALARRRHNSFGKTEMWYIMDADPGSSLIVGFNRDVQPREYQEALAEGRLTELLHYEPVSEGDAYFINAGKIHAIGGGILLAEIQQTSDVTYRVYDFDRRDAQGKLRELHTEQALEAMDFKQRDDFCLTYDRTATGGQVLADTPYFTTHFLHLTADTQKDLSDRDSFTVLVCVDGTTEVVLKDGRAQVRRGETILIPACAEALTLRTKGCKLLEVHL